MCGTYRFLLSTSSDLDAPCLTASKSTLIFHCSTLLAYYINTRTSYLCLGIISFLRRNINYAYCMYSAYDSVTDASLAANILSKRPKTKSIVL